MLTGSCRDHMGDRELRPVGGRWWPEVVGGMHVSAR